jgi:hypothetical protein
VAILPQAFFPLVGSHFVSFSFFTAGHNILNLNEWDYFTLCLTSVTNVLAGLKAGML